MARTSSIRLEKEADLCSVQMLLGHSSIATSEIYTHLAKGQVKKSMTSSIRAVKKR